MEFVIDKEQSVIIPYENIELEGLFHLPNEAKGIVIFAHGSGSSRFSPRNQYIAKELQKSKFATLLFDLLTAKEEAIDETTREYRFNIPFLGQRLIATTNWILEDKNLSHLSLGYFGASTGGGAALFAAAGVNHHVKAVVSRGGRPDLANEALPLVKAATLLIIGGDDRTVIQLNEQAYAQLKCEKKLEIIPDASHLFEEPGKLEEVSRLAKAWFQKYLV